MNNIYTFLCWFIGLAAIPLVFSIVEAIVTFCWEIHHYHKIDKEAESHSEEDISDEEINDMLVEMLRRNQTR